MDPTDPKAGRIEYCYSFIVDERFPDNPYPGNYIYPPLETVEKYGSNLSKGAKIGNPGPLPAKMATSGHDKSQGSFKLKNRYYENSSDK